MESRKTGKKIKKILISFFTSGKYKEQGQFGMSDYFIRYVLLNFISSFGGAILMGFIIVRLMEGKYGTVAACSGMFLITVFTIIFSRSKKMPQIVPAFMLMVFYGFLCIMITWLGEAEGTNYLFIYMYPLITIILLGMKLGIIFSTFLLITISLQMLIPSLSIYNYSLTVPIHVLITYFLVFSVMIVIETTRKTKDRLIDIQNKKLIELKEEAQAASRTKSNFLANMSHEIRTPMNAIAGMTDMLLRGDLSESARGHAQDIKQAGSNLISIINDILDFSKIETGKMEILPVKYLLSSLVNDTISMIRMKLIEKSVRFYTNIDSNISNGLIGDETRLRQIFLNLLSNAAKYTVKGHIGVSITQTKKEGSRIWLQIVVTDTGIGIKPENLEKIFTGFAQVDTKKNHSDDSKGLGLAITKRLCQLMGGDITVQSGYGSGSVFTVTIPQEVYLEKPFATVDEYYKKKVLLYEGRISYAQSLSWSLENMKVPHTLVTNQESFTEALFREEWFFVFSGYGLYEKIMPVMEKPDESFPGGKKPPIALMVEWGTEAFLPGVRFLSIPVQSLSISNILNGKADIKGYYNASADYGAVRFTFPTARLLVVDDILTNLKVAEGLLAPYQATVDLCLSGTEAIELVKLNRYDLIFMDHMMPEMDGIETVAAIRKWEKEQEPLFPIPYSPVPIIALTANAISGIREMFIENGFNDFLAKPIDISKLDELLAQWLPKEKRDQEKLNTSPAKKETINNDPQPLTIPGINMVKGLALTGGKIEFYHKVLSMYIKDAKDRLPNLQTASKADDLLAFITHAHSLKGASASIGAEEVSAEAALLEAAGKAKDINTIEKKLPAFEKQLAELINNISRALESKEAEKPVAISSSLPVSLLRELRAALKIQKLDDIDRILNDLGKKQLDSETRDILEKISDEVLMSEFDRALEIITGLLPRG